MSTCTHVRARRGASNIEACMCTVCTGTGAEMQAAHDDTLHVLCFARRPLLHLYVRVHVCACVCIRVYVNVYMFMRSYTLPGAI
jgi:hypothetical protein